MELQFYTIGMAGHIDHGKTELTKALTQVDTDRLKEEKERRISIELGYAPFYIGESMQASIIDVPGHEKFIRQMIAGVAGIDLVIIVIAADEGMMPQTQEHIEILSFLGIHRAVIAITKSDKEDAQWLGLVKEDVKQAVHGTPFEDTEIVFVDSVSGTGIGDLTRLVKEKLAQVPRKKADGSFRLPIDQVFTIQGQGTVVRGTVFEGWVRDSDTLKVLPQGKEVRVRQIQVQHQEVNEARAGQRAGLNIGGISRHELNRGDVLVGLSDDLTTQRLDVSLSSASHIQTPLKQRALLNIHIGTAIVMGKIIFFDRNKMESGENVLCQLQLEEPVAAKRGERLIIRRPSPVQTLGGGWVIDAQAKKHRFGEETVHELRRKKEGTPEDRLLDILRESPILSKGELLRKSGLSDDTLIRALSSLKDAGQIQHTNGGLLILTEVFMKEREKITREIKHYHDHFSLRAGVDKAEIIQSSSAPSALTRTVLEDLKEKRQIKQSGPYLAMFDFIPGFPKDFEKSMSKVMDDLKMGGMQVPSWENLVGKQDIPAYLCDELKHYLLQQGFAYKLDSTHLVHRDAVCENAYKLFRETAGDSFTLQKAKSTLDLSRKYLVPFLELLDELKYTLRIGNERKWRKGMWGGDE